jgi:hypothetical protein
MTLQILIQIDEMNPAGLLKVAIELDAFAKQFQPIVDMQLLTVRLHDCVE